MKAQLGWYVFDVSPTNMSWGYSMTTKKFDTYGGRVVQLLSCKIDDITLKGYVPCRGQETQFANMEEMEEQIRDLMDWQAENKKPIAFSFPALGWSGDVYITKYGDVSYSYDLVAATYTITMSVDNGFDEILESITDDALQTLQNVPDGVNWRYSVYNTPSESDWQVSLDALKAILEDSGNYGSVQLQDYYDEVLRLTEEKKNGATQNGSSGNTLVGQISEGIGTTLKKQTAGIFSVLSNWLLGTGNG